MHFDIDYVMYYLMYQVISYITSYNIAEIQAVDVHDEYHMTLFFYTTTTCFFKHFVLIQALLGSLEFLPHTLLAEHLVNYFIRNKLLFKLIRSNVVF